MSDQTARSEGSPPDPTPAREPSAGDDNSPPDPEPSADGGSSKLLTGGGLVAAFGFIALIIAIRGGKALFRKAIEEPATPPLTVKFGPLPGPGAASGLEHVFQRQDTLRKIDALRRQHGLTEEEMAEVLKAVWLEENEGSGERPPWEPRATTPAAPTPPPALLGKTGEAHAVPAKTAPAAKSIPNWWRYVDWDIDMIEEELDARKVKKNEPKPAKGK